MTRATVASVVVSLDRHGGLQATLTGSNGQSHSFPLRESADWTVERALLTILRAQAQGQSAIGQDGSPTAALAVHWRRHGKFADPRCPFCRADKQERGLVAEAIAKGELAKIPQGKSGLAANPPKAPRLVETGRTAKSLGL